MYTLKQLYLELVYQEIVKLGILYICMYIFGKQGNLNLIYI